jgi:RNA polymerase sigma factor (sigma-70 family)
MTVVKVAAAGEAGPGATGAADRPRAARRACAELVYRCQDGDEQAWAELVHICTPLVWTVARSFGLRTADCEDVSQLTWIRVVQNIGSLREADKIATWIATTARREAIRLIAKSDRDVPVGDGSAFSDLADADGTPEEVTLSRADETVAMAAFRLLPPEHQQLLGMLIADRPSSYDEISAALQIPRGSIGPTRARILRNLRDRLIA